MKTMILLSGGIDSSVCLALAVKKYGNENVLALNVFYGQRHSKETEAAKNIANFYSVRILTLDLSKLFIGCKSCSLLVGETENNISTGSYKEQMKKSAIPDTYVPFRNGVFLSLAASIAISNSCDKICYGAHLDDVMNASVYPDCSSFFYSTFSEAIYVGSGGMLSVLAPFINKSKSHIVHEGLKFNVPFKLTWSCYAGREKACGRCATCLDRKLAFASNGVEDPIEYEQ